MERQRPRTCYARLASLAAIVLLLSPPILAEVVQQHKSPQQPGATKGLADIARWRYLLEDLAVEARALAEPGERVLVSAEVADAYWEIDPDRSRELFMSALEAALSLEASTGEASRSLRRVLNLAARRDALLARKLMGVIQKSASDEDWSSAEFMSVATDLLDADVQRAAQLAEAGASAGPSLSSAWFILQLSKRDPVAAERMYGAYLNSFSANPQFGLERLLWLSGYPFGYAEAFGAAEDPARMPGFSGLRVSGLTSKPALAGTFLDVAFRTVRESLEAATTAAPTRREALSTLALFASTYLLPEVQRYRPQALQGWLSLRQQALSGTTAAQREGVDARVREILASRARAVEQESGELYESGRTEETLARAEKLPGGCARDTEYARAALAIGYTKDFLRALEVAGRIGDESMRSAVRQYIYYDMAVAATTRGDAGGLADAQKYADLLTPPEQRALLYVRMAKAALRGKDRQSAARLLREAMRLADTVTEATPQTGIFLVAAAGFADFDGYEGYKALKEAVKVVNRSKAQNVEDFHVLRKVNLTCFAGKESWYGSSERSERFSLFDTFAAMAGADPDGMLSLARELDDPSTRMRSLISIVKAMVRETRGGSPAPRPQISDSPLPRQ